MAKKRFADMGYLSADEFLQGEHPNRLSEKEAGKLGIGEEIIEGEPETTQPINSLPSLSEGQYIKREVIDPIRPGEFQRPDYFYLREYQEVYVTDIGTGLKIKAFLKRYLPESRKCEIWLADDSGEIDFKQTKLVQQNLIFVKI
jgi:hypothetical protein